MHYYGINKYIIYYIIIVVANATTIYNIYYVIS